LLNPINTVTQDDEKMINQEISVTSDQETRIKRLRYRSWHRGWKETDLILGKFADTQLAGMDATTIDVYERLLDENDADIWDWLVGKLPAPDDAYMPILEELKKYSQNNL
jgi:antitoxin CptB